MPKYLLLAEKISKNIKKEHTNNHLKNLNNLIMEIKKAIDLLRKSLLQVHPIYQCSD